MPKALFNFTIGVFGLAAKLENGVVRIKVNVRTDQERQWELAKLNPIQGVQLVDCPGGGIMEGETPISALVREIKEETGGCTFEPIGEFSKPLFFFNADLSKPSDAAMWIPIKLIGKPKPSNEALSHPWISQAEFDAQEPYRCISGLGKLGRTGQMMAQALAWFDANRDHPEIFS